MTVTRHRRAAATSVMITVVIGFACFGPLAARDYSPYRLDRTDAAAPRPLDQPAQTAFQRPPGSRAHEQSHPSFTASSSSARNDNSESPMTPLVRRSVPVGSPVERRRITSTAMPRQTVRFHPLKDFAPEENGETIHRVSHEFNSPGVFDPQSVFGDKEPADLVDSVFGQQKSNPQFHGTQTTRRVRPASAEASVFESRLNPNPRQPIANTMERDIFEWDRAAWTSDDIGRISTTPNNDPRNRQVEARPAAWTETEPATNRPRRQRPSQAQQLPRASISKEAIFANDHVDATPSPLRPAERPVSSPQPAYRLSSSRPGAAPVIRQSGGSTRAGTPSRVAVFEDSAPLPRRAAQIVEQPYDASPHPSVVPFEDDQASISRRLPVGVPIGPDRIVLDAQNGMISLTVRDAPLKDILSVIAEAHGLSVVTSGALTSTVSGSFTNVTLEESLNAILAIGGFTWVRQGNIIMVTSVSGDTIVSPETQGRQLRVFTLNFVKAEDVERVATGLLSPVGHVYAVSSSPLDRMKTQEKLVVEDLPNYITRIGDYICQIDQPPLQVSIEAHILQVDLTDETSHGVDFSALSNAANSQIGISSPDFNKSVFDLAAHSSKSYNIGIVGSDLATLIELVKSTTDARTLATPRVLVLNGQEAQIQIGDRLGYFVSTTTQTSTVQSVEFIETGVVLNVTPHITDDGQILMTVKPEVSTGEISDLGLPSERTTQVETNIMLPDGHGMIIGGLIKEVDSDVQTKVPVLGELWLVGRAFQKRKAKKERSEIIIALVPRIVPYGHPVDQARELNQLERATSPLLDDQLESMPRLSESTLPDAMNNPRSIAVDRLPDALHHLGDPRPLPKKHFFPTAKDRLFERDHRHPFWNWTRPAQGNVESTVTPRENRWPQPDSRFDPAPRGAGSYIESETPTFLPSLPPPAVMDGATLYE